MSHPKKALLTIKVKRKYSIRLKTGQIFHPSLKLCQYCFTQMAADLVGWDVLLYNKIKVLMHYFV